MSKNSKISGIISNVSFSLRKHSPEILIGAGVVGVVVSTVLACKATLKADDVLKDAGEKVKAIDDKKDISEKDAKKEKVAV